MILRKLWERYLFHEILKVFLFFIFSFYLLYALIDYSIHAHHFSKILNLNWIDLLTYYFCLLIKRIDLVLPLALLISTNKILLHLNQKNEMIALFVGGLKKTELLRPFFTLASFITLIILLNFEYVTPYSLEYLEQFENQHFKKDIPQDYTTPSTYVLPLENGGKFIFSKYNAQNTCFEDVFYIQSQDDLWKIKFLIIENNKAIGHFVEHLIRDEHLLLVENKSYETYIFSDLIIDLPIRKKTSIPFEHRSISSLYSLIAHSSHLYQENASKIHTQLFFKLCIPFVSFLVIIACAPFCMIFSRKLPIFMIYAMSIFGIIAFFTVIDAAVILGENHIFPPILAISLPFLLCLGSFGLKFINTYSK